jgi:hypothetical protein
MAVLPVAEEQQTAFCASAVGKMRSRETRFTTEANETGISSARP